MWIVTSFSEWYKIYLVISFSFSDKYAAIHAEAPEFADMSVDQEILVTGIKVVDLLAPYVKGKLFHYLA